MTPVKFTAYVTNTTELCQLDLNGEVIPRDKQTMFCAELQVECVSSDKSIDLEFVVKTELPFSRLPPVEKGRDRTVSVGMALAKLGIPLLAKYSHIKIYGGELLPMPGVDVIPDASDAYHHEMNEEINESLATQFRDATARHRSSTEHFEESKKYLLHNAERFRFEPALALSHARFVAEYMRKSSDRFMGAWNSEKSAVLISYVEDLIGRKNTSHPGFIGAVEWIESTLYSARPSKFWNTPPI